MGKILLPPLKFILLFIISAAVFLAFTLIYNWGLWISLSQGLRNNLLLFLPSAAYGVILPSITTALLFSFFSYRSTKISPFAAAITTAAVFAIILFGFRFTASMQDNLELISYQPFNERKLQATENSIIYTDKIPDSETVTGIIVRSYDSKAPGFRFYDRGKLIKGRQPELEIGEQRSIAITPVNPVFYDVFQPDKALGKYLSDFSELNGFFRQTAYTGGLQFLLLAAVMSIFLMACMLFRGATVWPLFDFILILGFHRAVYYLFGLMSKEKAFLSETLFGGSLPENIQLLFFAAASLIIIVLGVLIRITSRGRAK